MTKRRLLKPNTRIRLLVNGFATYVRVKDIAQAEGLEAVAEFNRIVLAGDPCTGRLARFGKYDIQIDLA